MKERFNLKLEKSDLKSTGRRAHWTLDEIDTEQYQFLSAHDG